MKSAELYFLISGVLISAVVSLFVALNNKKQGYYFWRTFMFGFLGLLVLLTLLFTFFFA